MFKVGEKVRFIGKEFGIKGTHGMVGEVVMVSKDNTCVEFYENMGGHSGCGKGKSGHCWWIDDDLLERVSTKLKLPTGNFIVKSSEPSYSKRFVKDIHVQHNVRWFEEYDENLTYHDEEDIYYIIEDGIMHYAIYPSEFSNINYPIYNIEDLFYENLEENYKFNTTDDVEKVIVNKPAVIIFTKDGYKGVAVCDDKDEFNHNIGYKIAYAKIERTRTIKKLKEINKLLKSYL